MAGKVTVDVNGDDDILVSAGVLAKMAGKTTRTINNYDKSGMPYDTQGSRKVYPVRRCLEWMIVNGHIRIEMDTGDDLDRESLPPSIRKDLADAELKEHKLNVERGKYILRDEAVEAAGKILTVVKTRALAIGPKLAPIVAAERDKSKVQSIIDDAVYEALDELSKLEDL